MQVGTNLDLDLDSKWKKLDGATKYHDIVGMLDTHLNQKEVDVMINGNKNFF